MATDNSERLVEKGLNAAADIFESVERYKEQRKSGSPAQLSRLELDELAKRLNAGNTIQTHSLDQKKTEMRIDASVNGVRAKVAVPNNESPVRQALENVQSRTRASDLFTLGVLGGQAASTFNQEERDLFLKLEKDRGELQKRFSRAISDHPAFRGKEQEIWNNFDKGVKLLQSEDWREKLGLIADTTDVKTGVDALKNDAIRQAKFIAFTRDMESHRKAFHQAASTTDQNSIVKKAEERIATFSKGLPLSEKAEVRKQSLSFIQAIEARKAQLKQLFSRKLRSPAINVGNKKGFSH